MSECAASLSSSFVLFALFFLSLSLPPNPPYPPYPPYPFLSHTLHTTANRSLGASSPFTTYIPTLCLVRNHLSLAANASLPTPLALLADRLG